MKILLISNGKKALGGWSTYTQVLAKELKSDGHDIYHANDLGEPLPYFTNPFIAWINVWKLKKTIKALNPGIIQKTIDPVAPRKRPSILAADIIPWNNT